MTPARVLVLFTASYPYGPGEPFITHEIPYLAAAFDEVVIVSNDAESPQAHSLPGSVSCLRMSYELPRRETVRAICGLLQREVRRELGIVRHRYGLPLTRRAWATVLVSWRKATRTAELLRDLAADRPGAEIHAYAYWADDMAVGAAMARRRGWVRRAVSRAHGWDVYHDRAEPGFLPFRLYLATHLDHLRFVSEHGRRYFESLVGPHPSVGCSRLGTPAAAEEPLGRRRPFTLVSCSRLIPLKRVDLIARSLAYVRAAVRWIHVGDGPARGVVEAICRDLPPHVSVELVGHLPNPEVLALYRSRRPSAFVNVSETEGLPVSIMEAMSVGLPVIGTDVGGVGEIVRHGGNGLLLRSEADPVEVAGAMDTIAELSEARYGRFAAAAWRTWREGFHAADNYREFVDLILQEEGADG